MFYSPLRYPGGKGKILDFMKKLIEVNNLYGVEYIEPYAGGSAIALGLLLEGYVSKIYINDSDKAIFAFWQSILSETEIFIKKIYDTPITVEEWQKQRDIYNHINDFSVIELGFAAFFLNRCNRSGIIKGGMIGGYAQDGEWKIDARFNKEILVQRIEKIANFKKKIKLYNQDTYKLLSKHKFDFRNSILYLDPPYYEKGCQLYKNHYKADDHKKIADLIKSIDGFWIVSYDNVPQILDLFENVNNRDFNISYSAGRKRSGKEIMFFSEKLTVPDVAIC